MNGALHVIAWFNQQDTKTQLALIGLLGLAAALLRTWWMRSDRAVRRATVKLKLRARQAAEKQLRGMKHGSVHQVVRLTLWTAAQRKAAAELATQGLDGPVVSVDKISWATANFTVDTAHNDRANLDRQLGQE